MVIDGDFLTFRASLMWSLKELQFFYTLALLHNNRSCPFM